MLSPTFKSNDTFNLNDHGPESGPLTHTMTMTAIIERLLKTPQNIDTNLEWQFNTLAMLS